MKKMAMLVVGFLFLILNVGPAEAEEKKQTCVANATWDVKQKTCRCNDGFAYCRKDGVCKKWVYQKCAADAECHNQLLCKKGFGDVAAGNGVARKLGLKDQGLCVTGERFEFWSKSQSEKIYDKKVYKFTHYPYPGQNSPNPFTHQPNKDNQQEICRVVKESPYATLVIRGVSDTKPWDDSLLSGATASYRQRYNAATVKVKKDKRRDIVRAHVQQDFQRDQGNERAKSVQKWIEQCAPGVRVAVSEPVDAGAEGDEHRGANVTVEFNYRRYIPADPPHPGDPPAQGTHSEKTIIQKYPGVFEFISLQGGLGGFFLIPPKSDARIAAMLNVDIHIHFLNFFFKLGGSFASTFKKDEFLSYRLRVGFGYGKRDGWWYLALAYESFNVNHENFRLDTAELVGNAVTLEAGFELTRHLWLIPHFSLMYTNVAVGVKVESGVGFGGGLTLVGRY